MSSVGWIGVGDMGAPMVERLLMVGVDVSIWNRTPSKADPLVAQGARAVGAASGLASFGAVFIIVSDATAVRDVLVGPAGLFSGSARPSVVVNCSTVSQEDSAALRALVTQAGAEYIVAPIAAAASMILGGGAAIVASGPPAAYALVEPHLRAIAPTCVYAGDADSALLVKVGSEVLMAAFTQAMFEIADVLSAAGVEGTAFLDFINGSAIGSRFSEFKAVQYQSGQRTLTPDLRVFRMRSLDDYLRVAAGNSVPVPVGEVIRHLA